MKYADFVLREINSNEAMTKKFGDLIEKINETSNLYQAVNQGKDISQEQREVLTEVIAQYTSENLFTNEEQINRLARVDRNFFQKVVDWFKDTIGNFQHKKNLSKEEKETVEFLKRAEKLYSKALGEAWGASDHTNYSLGRDKFDANKKKRYNNYNQYDTLAKQWAFSPKTKVGDKKVLFNAKTNEYNLIIATKDDNGFTVAQSVKDTESNIEIIKNIYSEVYSEHRDDQSLYESVDAFRAIARSGRDDLSYVENGKTNEQNGGLHRDELQSNGNADIGKSNGTPKNAINKTQYSLKEKSYEKAIESGDIEAAQKLVDNAAKLAGYTIKAYHGSRYLFNEFSKNARGSNTHTKVSNNWFFAGDEETANSYYPYGTMKYLAKNYPNMFNESEVAKESKKEYAIYIEDKQEYAKLSQEFARKNGNTPRKAEYAYTDKYFYIVDNNRLGNFSLKLQVGIVGNEDLIDTLREEIDNGSYRTAKTIAQWIGIIQSREGSNDRNNDITSATKANGRTNEVYGEQSERNPRRDTSKNGGNSKVKFSLISTLTEGIDNGTFKGTNSIDEVLNDIGYRKGSNDRYSTVSSKAEAVRRNVDIHREQSERNPRRDTSKNGGNSKVKFSLTTDNKGRKLTEAQAEFFKDSKVRDDGGNLLTVYHGTIGGGFNVFDASRANVESDMGAGFYFTSDYDDVSNNYEKGGQDFENKISRLAEQIENDEEIDYEEAKKKAAKKLKKGSKLFEVYLDIKNPTYVGGNYDSDTYLFENLVEEIDRDEYDTDEDYEEALYEAQETAIQDVVDKVDRILSSEEISGYEDWVSICSENGVFEGGITIKDLKELLENNLFDVSNEKGDIATSEVVRAIIEALGYDGIIDSSVVDKWGYNSGRNSFMEGIDEETRHYIVFKPNQIKLTTNLNPTSNPDIRYSLKQFSEQVDDVLSGKQQRDTDVFVMHTPKILQDVGLSKLPMLMTAKHIKTINLPKNNAKHQHGVPVEIIKKIPEMISNPVMIMDSISVTPNNSIVIIGDEVVDNEPMLIAVRVDGQGVENKIIVDSNFITSAYGRHNFEKFIENNIKANSFLYVDKKRSLELLRLVGVQFPEGFNNLDFNIIIRKTKANVNSFYKNTQYSLKEGESEPYYKLTEGQLKKVIANNTKYKVYTLADSEAIINNVLSQYMSFGDKYGELSGKTKKQVIDMLWKGLNSADPGYQMNVALNIADYIIQNGVLENMWEDEDLGWAIDTIDILKPYLHSIDLANIKGEIKNKYDTDNSPYLLWGKRRGSSGIAPNELSQLLEETGIQIDAVSEADIFMQVDELYKSAIKALKKKAKSFLSEGLSNEELKTLRQEIAREILRGYDYAGGDSKLANIVNKYTDRIRVLKEQLQDEKVRNSVINRLLDKTQKLKDLKLGTFLNTTEFKSDIFKGSIEKLAAIKFRGDLNQSGTRDIVTSLVELSQYKSATEEVRAKAIKYIYDIYYNLALEDLLGVDLKNKNLLFAEAIEMEKLAIIVAQARELSADTDKNGRTVSGSKKAKVKSYVNGLGLSAVQKYMIMGYLGYKNLNGENQVKTHIQKLKLTKKQKETLFTMSGYEKSKVA